MLWSSPPLEAVRWLEACLVAESGSQPSHNLAYRKSHFMGSDTASSRSWWRPAAMSVRCRNGLATIAWPSPSPATAVCSRTARTRLSTASMPFSAPVYDLPKDPLSRELRNRAESPKSPRATLTIQEAKQNTRPLASCLVRQYLRVGLSGLEPLTSALSGEFMGVAQPPA